MNDELLLSEEEIREAAVLLGEALGSYQSSLEDRPVFPDLDRGAIRRILDEPLPEEGIPWREIFREFGEELVPNSTHIAHPRYLAYVIGSPHGIAPFAEAMAAALNQNCAIWQLSPIASAIEQKVLAWFREIFGMPAEGAGYLTSGGSMANWSGVLAARDWRLGEDARGAGLQRGGPPLVLYASDEVHGSIDKAAAMMGLGVDNVHRIPTNDRLEMRVDAVEQAIARDRRDGKLPFCLVASAGTITTGAIDPIGELSELCRREDLWLHVDGAYGAFTVLTERLAPHVRDAGLADSLALDPHKLLFNPLEAGCVLYRDSDAPHRSFDFTASYIAKPADPDFIDFSEYGPELSRGFKALKVWWALRVFGRHAYTRAIDRLLDLAQVMARRIEDEPSLELMAPVNLTAVCLRVRDLDDDGQARLVLKLRDSGIGLLGPARVRGRAGLRACMTNLRTNESDVDQVVSAVVRLAREL